MDLRNEEKLLPLLNDLNAGECRELIRWLEQRVHDLDQAPMLDKPLADLPMSTRAHNVLTLAGYKSLRELLDHGGDKIGLIKNIGAATKAEILSLLAGADNLQADGPSKPGRSRF